MHRIPTSLYLLLFITSASVFAGGTKPPYYSDDDLEIRGSGFSTGCTDSDLEKATSGAQRARINEARRNDTTYAEFILFTVPSVPSLFSISGDGSKLSLNMGMRLGRCDEILEDTYRVIPFRYSNNDNLSVFRRHSSFRTSGRYSGKYSEQSSGFRKHGLVNIEMPLNEILDPDEKEQLNAGRSISMTLWVFHGVNRESEARSFGLGSNRWIFLADRNKASSQQRVKRVTPFFVIDLTLKQLPSKKLSVSNIRYNFRK